MHVVCALFVLFHP